MTHSPSPAPAPGGPVIVCASRGGNTRRVADAVAETLGASVLDARDPTWSSSQLDRLLAADLVGFGSGIYGYDVDRALRRLLGGTPATEGQRAFVFTTSGLPSPPGGGSRRLARLVRRTGREVVGRFECRGLDTWGPFALVGGVSRGRPSAADLHAARDFAAGLPVSRS